MSLTTAPTAPIVSIDRTDTTTVGTCHRCTWTRREGGATTAERLDAWSVVRHAAEAHARRHLSS